MLRAMRILVTGATGFVGGAVARRYLGDGAEVVAYVRDESRAGALADAGAEVRVGSIGDPNAIADAAAGADALIHCAAVGDVNAAPRALSWVNVAGTENVANAAIHAGCRRMVHMSCADVTLDNEDRVNIGESWELLNPALGHHARSKAVAEGVALSSSSEEMGVVALRPAWIWGPGDTARLPSLVSEGLARGIQLVGRGDNLVAVTYIDNLVDAVQAAVTAEAAIARPYYVADNEFLSVREFVGALSEAVGLPAPRKGGGFVLAHAMAVVRSRTGGAGLSPVEVVKRGRSNTFDISKGQRDLEWEPRVGLDEGMKALAKWVGEVGGAEAVAALARPFADAASVDAQVTAAGGD